jgi:hypothetical protein
VTKDVRKTNVKPITFYIISSCDLIFNRMKGGRLASIVLACKIRVLESNGLKCFILDVIIDYVMGYSNVQAHQSVDSE